MRDDISPFEKVEEAGRTKLRLWGEKDQRTVVKEDKIPIILDAIVERWDIDIRYAIIDGDLDISPIANQLKDDKGKPIIKGDVSIYDSEIRGNANFSSATFSGDTGFCLATFGNADFYSAIFSGYADFSSATFGNADFYSATFSSYADFRSATYSNDADFRSATFNGHADFNEAVFDKNADFAYSFFGKYVNLDKAVFNEIAPLSFDSIGDAYVRSSVKGGHFFFQKAGEGYLVGEPDYPSASDSFRNAKVEYEKEGRYDEASRAYVEEMKCVKKSSGWWKNKRYWFWEFTCNYGEAWGRFILWIFGTITTCANYF